MGGATFNILAWPELDFLSGLSRADTGTGSRP